MKALHEERLPELKPTVLPGYQESWETIAGEKWPTLHFRGAQHEVSGDIIDIKPEQMIELDDWEERYRRKLVFTHRGEAWAFFFKGTDDGPKAA